MNMEKSKELLNYFRLDVLNNALKRIKSLDNDTEKWEESEWSSLRLAVGDLNLAISAEHMTCLVDMGDQK